MNRRRQTSTTVLVAPPSMDGLRSTLAWAALVRGMAALVIGTYVLARMPASAVGIARVIAAYWIVDGLVVLTVGRRAGDIALGRGIFVLRGIIALAAGIALLGLPLDAVSGPWRPGHVLIVTVVTATALTMIGLQVVMVAFDAVICAAVSRHMGGGWSAPLGAALSVLLALGAAATFAGRPTGVGFGIGAVALAASIALLASALSLLLGGQHEPGVSPRSLDGHRDGPPAEDISSHQSASMGGRR